MREKNISDWPNNNAVIAGCVVDTPMYEFSVGNKSYYRVTISARRLSGTEDLVPCYIEDCISTAISSASSGTATTFRSSRAISALPGASAATISRRATCCATSVHPPAARSSPPVS